MTKKSIFLSVLAIASLAGLWFVQSPLHGKGRDSANRPEEYMHQVHLTLFTEEGSLKSTLSAQNWTYLSKLSVSTLTLPKLTVYKPDDTIWLISATSGVTTHETLGSIEEISLKDNVVLECPATKKAFPLKLETHELQYHPKQQYAHSEQWIQVTKPGITITGRGLRAFIAQNSLELLHDVKTHYIVAR